MTKIIIVRHCETIFNSSGKIQSYYKDSDFTEKGKKQLAQLVSRLKKEKISAVFCSDLGRALKTAEAIAKAHNLKSIPLKGLRECDIGDWHDLSSKEAIAKWTVFYEAEKKKGVKREEIRPPNGENSFDHQKRVMDIVNKIVEDFPNETVVIVGHSGTNKLIISSLQNKDPDDFYNIEQSNAGISIIEINGKTAKIISVNDTSHITD
ncbi:MAG: Alpha-ribazole phosphatase [Candidatus Daviesbacteria bacterium GW2011_GWB1_41_5]|uniref:Alpha-ribazole phosphatase n=1 Tax=Candidatus Daviesbacteria bacterium GW2011_GWB1_41_5 TaxID=1618429 RepID=A0A0G0WDS1_9BACT|nr:MAG: Alpha-ribazole phosphatase [Candidatus Daviesbacteria bacterium GW2011_GWB1_41_5]